MKIGARIKDLRTRQRVTLKELAKKADLTASFLSQLERNLVSPSVSSLEKIAEALGVQVGYFFEREEGKELIFVKKGIGKKVIGKEKKIVCESFASGLLNIKMQPQLFTLGNGAELSEELKYPQGEKFVIVFKGKVELLCDTEKLVLEEGDSIYCAYSKRIHKTKNIGTSKAQLLCIAFIPT